MAAPLRGAPRSGRALVRSGGVLVEASVDSASDDLALVRRLLDGDEAAYTLIRGQIERVFGQVLGRLSRRFGDLSPLRADLLQSLELFLVKDGYRVLGTYRGDARLSTWLHAVAMRHLAAEITRARARARREQPAAELEAPAIGTDPELRVVRASERARVRRALEGLDPEERLLVALFFEQGLDATQAGRALGLRPSAVRMRKKRLLDKLQAKLGGEP